MNAGSADVPSAVLVSTTCGSGWVGPLAALSSVDNPPATAGGTDLMVGTSALPAIRTATY